VGSVGSKGDSYDKAYATDCTSSARSMANPWPTSATL
jgi:hypothetical protein